MLTIQRRHIPDRTDLVLVYNREMFQIDTTTQICSILVCKGLLQNPI